MRLIALGILGMGTLALVGCGSRGQDSLAASGDDLIHIHDMALDENGSLLVASHSGLYRIDAEDQAIRIGELHDLMSMTILADGELLASGHPNLLLEEFSVEGRPPFLGLARSDDGGQSWTELDLLGEADFHALVNTSDGLYAAEASGDIWLQDTKGQWSTLGSIEARDLAIDPSDPRLQLAPDFGATVWLSTDAATTWSRLPGAPPLIEIEWVADDLIVGVTEAGSIWSADNVAGPWSDAAMGPAGVETFYVDGSGSWWLSKEGGSISRSDDQGDSWAAVYTPPTS